MRTVTLAMFVKDGRILLAMKKRGFGAGNWNGYGGKLLEGESVEDAAVREIHEESGARVEKEDLKHLGTLDFYFSDKPEWDQRCVIYRVQKWRGDPVETEEMRPEWFFFEDVPYEHMWKGDDQWFPYFLRGENFSGEIHFSDEGKKVVSVQVAKE